MWSVYKGDVYGLATGFVGLGNGGFCVMPGI